MVMHHSMPDKIHDKPLSSPPNINHSMFPNKLISYDPLLSDTSASLTNDKPDPLNADNKFTVLYYSLAWLRR